MRQNRSSQHLTLSQSIDQVCDKEAQLKQISRRNMELKRQYEMSQQGVILDISALEPEATWVRRMRLSESEQLRNLHAELVSRTLSLSMPPKLDRDRCLARVLKFCLFLSQQIAVSPKSLERPYADFKTELPQTIRIEEKRDELMLLCRNIYLKRQDIMNVDLQPDILEK